MPNIEIPDGATPGDIFRKIADYYDAHPDLAMPHSIDMATHRDEECYHMLRERFGATLHRKGGTRWADVYPAGKDSSPRIEISAFADHTDWCSHPGCQEEFRGE